MFIWKDVKQQSPWRTATPEWYLSLPQKAPAQCHFHVPLPWVHLAQAQTLLQLQTKLRYVSCCAPPEELPRRDDMAAKPLLVASGKRVLSQLVCSAWLKASWMFAGSVGWGRGALCLQGVWTCCLRSWAVWGQNVTPEKIMLLKRNPYFGKYTSDQDSHAWWARGTQCVNHCQWPWPWANCKWLRFLLAEVSHILGHSGEGACCWEHWNGHFPTHDLNACLLTCQYTLTMTDLVTHTRKISSWWSTPASPPALPFTLGCSNHFRSHCTA